MQVMRVKDIVDNDNIFSLFKWHLGVSEIPPWNTPFKMPESISHNVPLPEFSKKYGFSHPINTNKGFEYIKSLLGGVCMVMSNLPESIPTTQLPGKESNSIPSLDLAFEFNNIGLIHCKADLFLVRSSKAHIIVGPSILEDVIGVVFYDKNVEAHKKRKYSSKVFRRSFIYTIICSLLRERQIPVYLTSFSNLFLKSTLTITTKGIFAVSYSYLNCDDFVKDISLNLKSKSNSTSSKLSTTLCHFKSDLLPVRKRFYPFLFETNDVSNENEKKNRKKRDIKNGASENLVSSKPKIDEPIVDVVSKENVGSDSWDESSP